MIINQIDSNSDTPVTTCWRMLRSALRADIDAPAGFVLDGIVISSNTIVLLSFAL